MPERADAAFFDLGGTLYSYRGGALGLRPVLEDLMKEIGAPGGRDELRKAYATASQGAWGAYMPQPYYLHRDFFVDTYRRFAQALGCENPSEDMLQRCHERQRETVLTNFELRDDCLDTLSKLREAGVHVGIVSNIDDDYLHPMVASSGLDQVVDAWTSSEEAQSCKPDAGIFEMAMAKATRAVDPARSLFIGDSPEADVAGGRALGMATVLLQEEGMPEPRPEAPVADHTIRSLAEVLALAGIG